MRKKVRNVKAKAIDCPKKKGKTTAWTVHDENELIATVQIYKAVKASRDAFRAAHPLKKYGG